MRVLVVAPGAERGGGVARSVERIARALAAAGHRVGLARPDLRLFPGETHRARADGVERWSHGAGEDDVGPTVAAAEALSAEVLLGFYGPTGAHTAALAGGRLGVPVVAALRGNDVDRDLDDPVLGPRVAAAVAAAARVTAVSTEMVEKVRARLGVRAVFIGNSVDGARFDFDPVGRALARARLGFAASDPVVAMFGELKAKRGLGVLAEAVAGTPWRVLLVGRSRPEVRRTIDPSWVAVPFVDDDDDLRALYSAADLVAQPSLADGMPNVVLEAMACRRPVLATPVGGLRDLLRSGDNGLLAEPTDWPRRLAELAGRPLEGLGERARASLPSVEGERRAYEAVLLGALGAAP